MWVRLTLLSVTVVVACTPPRGIGVDAIVEQLCGNGRIDVDEDGLAERCDDGDLNGTVLCSKQCESGWIPAGPVVTRGALGFTPDTSVTVAFNGAKTGLASIAGDQLLVVHTLDFPAPATPAVSIPVGAPPITLGAVGVHAWHAFVPIWVEQDANGLSRLFIANVDAAGTVETHELPYPFPDGTAPVIVPDDTRTSAIIIDTSRYAPYDLLIAHLIVVSPGQHSVHVLRLPSPGRIRGAVYSYSFGDPAVTTNMQRVFQFFDDTGTYVAIDSLYDNGLNLNLPATSYPLREFSRGAWPFKVVAMAPWLEPCLLPIGPPYPMIVLADTGELFIWSFTRGLAPEEYLAPFGRFRSGSTIVGLHGPASVLLVAGTLEPDGDFVALSDSDCADPQSPALQEQRFPALGAWSKSQLVWSRGQQFAIVDDEYLRFDIPLKR